MTEVLYDESTFPEYEAKLRQDKMLAAKTLLGGVVAYVVLASGFALLVFPESSPEAKVRDALILLGIPISFGTVAVIGHWLNSKHPRRVTDDAIEAVSRWRLADIEKVVWQGHGKDLEVHLDPEKYRMATRRIRAESLLRPDEFLQALEGRVPIIRKDADLD